MPSCHVKYFKQMHESLRKLKSHLVETKVRGFKKSVKRVVEMRMYEGKGYMHFYYPFYTFLKILLSKVLNFVNNILLTGEVSYVQFKT